MSMFHSTTDRLIDYWRSRASNGVAPSREDVGPADFAELAPQVFLLGRERSGLYPVRLAGGLIADLHGCDLRAVNALSLWADSSRARLRAGLEEARLRPEPIVVTADAMTDAGELRLEILFAPLRGPSGDTDRFLGLYQPLGMTMRLLGRPVRTLVLRSLRTTNGRDGAPRLRLAALDGRLIA